MFLVPMRLGFFSLHTNKLLAMMRFCKLILELVQIKDFFQLVPVRHTVIPLYLLFFTICGCWEWVIWFIWATYYILEFQGVKPSHLFPILSHNEAEMPPLHVLTSPNILSDFNLVRSITWIFFSASWHFDWLRWHGFSIKDVRVNY